MLGLECNSSPETGVIWSRALPRVLAVFALVSVVLVAGCGSTTSNESSDGSTGGQAVSVTPDDTEIGQMSMADKASIATSFPVQVPVPAGRIVDAHAQGPDAWDYTLQLPYEPVDVADWYARRMTAANWQLLESSPRSDGGTNLTFAKAAAQSRVEVTPADGGSLAVVSIGVGAPVLETQ